MHQSSLIDVFNRLKTKLFCSNKFPATNLCVHKILKIVEFFLEKNSNIYQSWDMDIAMISFLPYILKWLKIKLYLIMIRSHNNLNTTYLTNWLQMTKFGHKITVFCTDMGYFLFSINKVIQFSCTIIRFCKTRFDHSSAIQIMYDVFISTI